MKQWSDLAKRVFKGAGLNKRKPRDCLTPESKSRSDCPNEFETFVNAFSTSLRASERMRRLVKLAETIERLHWKIVAYAEGQRILDSVQKAATEAIKARAAESKKLRVIQTSSDEKNKLIESLRKELEKHLTVSSIESVRFALMAFNQGAFREPGTLEDDIFETVRRRKHDGRLIVRLAGIAARQNPDSATVYVDHATTLWTYVKLACTPGGDLKTGPGWDKLDNGVVQLYELIVREAEETAKADCKFLKHLSAAESYTLGAAIRQFPLKSAHKPVVRPRSNGGARSFSTEKSL